MSKHELSETENDFDNALKAFFENNLKPGMAYGTIKNKSFTSHPLNGTLVYQDGTACSASYAFSDVFQMPDGTYIVKTDCGEAHFTGGSPEDRAEIYEKECQNMTEVLIELNNFCGHDPNTCGDMLRYLANFVADDRFKSKRELDDDFIMYIKSKPDIIQKLYEEWRDGSMVIKSISNKESCEDANDNSKLEQNI